MGSGSSKSTKSSNGNEISDTKQPWFSAKDLLESIADGWMVAGGGESMRILNTPGRIWGYITDWAPYHTPTFYSAVRHEKKGRDKHWFPNDGSYGSSDVLKRRMTAMVKPFAPVERHPRRENAHDDVSALAGRVLFYDYDFNSLDREDRVIQYFDLNDSREICGIIFLPSPVKYYPISKNYLESTGPHEPYLFLAIPQHMILNMTVNGKDVGDCANPANSAQTCFMSWQITEDVLQDRKIVLLMTVRKLQPGVRHCVEITVQFSYSLDTVSLLDVKNTQTCAAEGRNIYWGDPKVDRFILDEIKSVKKSQLMMREKSTGLMLSDVICRGDFEVVVPDKQNVSQTMSDFYDWGEK